LGKGSTPLRVALADDSLLFREGVARLLREAGLEVMGQAGDGEELIRLVNDARPEERPDVAIVDIRMPPTHTVEGLEAALRIRAEHPGVAVLVLSQYIETNHAVKLVGDGAGGTGYLLKDRISDLEGFAEAVRRVAGGGSAIDPEVVARLVERPRTQDTLASLTDREREILALIAEGRSNQAICERLFLTEKTVESHVRNIFTKLDLYPAADDNRRVLAVLAYLRSP
jgi:DNA-binding NarL/FixJ family response regulator